METYEVVIKPFITEKSMREATKGKFTFQVAQHAGKKEIRRTIERSFGVHVVGLSTITTKGKSKRFGAKRTEKALSIVKKAIITLKKGEKIDLFDIGGKKK
jgi:large subunit ribosomal protein L23